MGGGFSEVDRVQARVDRKGWWLAWQGRVSRTTSLSVEPCSLRQC